jgi:hypothetical protein
VSSSARKDEIAATLVEGIWSDAAVIPIVGSHQARQHAIERVKSALTSYEEERPACGRCEELEAIGNIPAVAVRSEARTLVEAVALTIDKAASEALRTPSAEGWQQRIAAMDPWALGHCFFCGCKRWNIPRPPLGADQLWSADMDDITEIERPHAPDCLWQHAKDATPPASHGEGAKDE